MIILISSCGISHYQTGIMTMCPRREGTSVNYEEVCAAEGLKPWPYLKMKDMKNYTLFNAQTRRITPHLKEKQNLRIAWSTQLYFLSVMLDIYN